jgi:hypothetical protein
LNRVIKERSPKERPIVVSKVPPREDVMEIACEAEEYPNKKISLDKFIGLFIPEEENYGTILDDMTIEGKIYVTTVILDWFGYEGEYGTQRQNFKKMLGSITLAKFDVVLHPNRLKASSTSCLEKYFDFPLQLDGCLQYSKISKNLFISLLYCVIFFVSRLTRTHSHRTHFTHIING